MKRTGSWDLTFFLFKKQKNFTTFQFTLDTQYQVILLLLLITVSIGYSNCTYLGWQQSYQTLQPAWPVSWCVPPLTALQWHITSSNTHSVKYSSSLGIFLPRRNIIMFQIIKICSLLTHCTGNERAQIYNQNKCYLK